MDDARMFPILSHSRPSDCPAAVPWRLVDPHEQQAIRNHGQSLETLARRGGLSPLELQCVVQDREFPNLMGVSQSIRYDLVRKAVHWIKALV